VQEKLEVTNQELRDATAKVAQAQKDLEGLELLENESRERTAQSEIKMEKNNLRLDLADTILALLNDASKVKDDQLLGIAEKLQQVVKTRKNLLGLPVDYQALRDRLLLWVETLLGKKLVTRESVDELTRKYGDLV